MSYRLEMKSLFLMQRPDANAEGDVQFTWMEIWTLNIRSKNRNDQQSLPLLDHELLCMSKRKIIAFLKPCFVKDLRNDFIVHFGNPVSIEHFYSRSLKKYIHHQPNLQMFAPDSTRTHERVQNERNVCSLFINLSVLVKKQKSLWNLYESGSRANRIQANPTQQISTLLLWRLQ